MTHSRIENTIDILTQLLDSRQEVFAVLTEILVSDCDLSEKARRKLFEELKEMERQLQVAKVELEPVRLSNG